MIRFLRVNAAPEPLWWSVVGEREPWRRGRVFLVIIGVLTGMMQLFTIAILILGGFIEQLFLIATVVAASWLGFYFVWIGVHWVRWLLGTWWALTGFAFCVWSLEAQSGALFINGLYLLGAGCYVALAPSVYFFAIRQRETHDWKMTVLVAASFGLLIASLATAVYGLGIYRTQMQSEARDFVDAAFSRVFAQHDTYFLLDHLTARNLAPPFGRGYWTKFLQVTTIRAGDVRGMQPASGSVRLRYLFPATLYVDGVMATEGICDRGRITMEMRMGGLPGNWQIEDVRWMTDH
jgi:hypothetical protein